MPLLQQQCADASLPSPSAAQGWCAIAAGAGGCDPAAAVAAKCMLALELSRVLPEWSNWLSADVLYIRWG